MGHLLRDSVGVQIYTSDVRRGHIKVKVPRVHAHDERTGCTEHIGQSQRTQRNVRARPVEGEDHLQRVKTFIVTLDLNNWVAVSRCTRFSTFMPSTHLGASHQEKEN